MSADLWLTVEFAGFLVAAALAAYSIAKFDLRPMIAGGAVAFCAWLSAAFFNGDQDPYEFPGLLTLHVQVVDAATGDTVQGAIVQVVASDEAGSSTVYRLPASVNPAADGSGPEVIRVSLFAERRIRGSLFEQFRNPAAVNELVDQQIEVVAPGYRPWRGALRQLLPDGWPAPIRPAPIVLELDRL